MYFRINFIINYLANINSLFSLRAAGKDLDLDILYGGGFKSFCRRRSNLILSLYVISSSQYELHMASRAIVSNETSDRKMASSSIFDVL